jgi:hypothetical protein
MSGGSRSRTVPAAELAVAGLVVVTLLAGCSEQQPADRQTADGQQASGEQSTSASSSPSPRPLVEGADTALTPGTYRLGYHLAAADDVVPDAFVTVPSGYVESSTWFVVSDDGDEYLGLWTAAEADRDACRHGEQDVYDPGPSVDDLARALVATRSIRASEPVPVTLAGYQGQYVELASPRHMSRCRDPEAGLWTSGDGGRGIYNDGQVDLVWILNADGQRIVVNAAYSAGSTASDIHTLTAMVESLEFVAAAQE